MKRTSNPLELVRLLINGANEYEKETGNKNPTVYLSRNNLLVIERALERLEAIDNANPSEALECLEYIENKLKDLEYIAKQNDNEYLLSKYIPSEKFNTIEQALLKAQEPKHYLKWEDLKFTDERQTIKVLLNGEKYFVKYKKEYLFGYYEKVEITNGTFILCTLGSAMKQFFNDLHLEVLE